MYVYVCLFDQTSTPHCGPSSVSALKSSSCVLSFSSTKRSATNRNSRRVTPIRVLNSKCLLSELSLILDCCTEVLSNGNNLFTLSSIFLFYFLTHTFQPINLYLWIYNRYSYIMSYSSSINRHRRDRDRDRYPNRRITEIVNMYNRPTWTKFQ